MSKIEYQLDDSQKKWSLRSPEWHTDIVSNKCEMKKWHTHTVTSIDCNLNVEICRILSIVNCSNLFEWFIRMVLSRINHMFVKITCGNVCARDFHVVRCLVWNSEISCAVPCSQNLQLFRVSHDLFTIIFRSNEFEELRMI